MEEQTEYEYEGCRFRFGVNCTNKEKCSSCGFNPKEEKLRKWMINQQLKHRTLDEPYHLRLYHDREEQ